MQIWLTILASWPAPLAPISVTAREGQGHRLHPVEGAASPPHITVSVCAPACRRHRRVDEVQAARAAAASSSRHVGRGGGVVDEDGARPCRPRRRLAQATPRRSSSLPTQQKTKSAPAAASAGAGACRLPETRRQRPRPCAPCGCRP
jgi:hypothetical protein